MPNYKKYYKDRMNEYREIRRGEKARYRERTGSNLYEPRPYSYDEDEMILKHEIPDRELAVFLQRSVLAIQHRRHRLKRWAEGLEV